MKFDLVEPSDEQAVLDEDLPEASDGGAARGVHPRLVMASARMRSRLRDDLAALHASLGMLNEQIQAVQRREEPASADAAPPANFRAGAFSRPGDS
ncbi:MULTISPECIES: hypothetical protein [Nocardiopsis]|uniref:Uncharacterized protein n=1 Tax=Nocardiopsis dassonvillei (strain ATCC 23218 / DSM 43111 / CIP 107115 / JCM 7437 / KCTC 9190 / NBRC 14626 / NCTC 10488 / NRRL B-5397 / IMRU 509) TaxID=446468 RepID=D7B8C3_NOCDD|nr:MULTISPECIES: hypothetical protein [Nocardiopsis]ADH70431.1 hypothetical protein Ndas_5050 [Nocardiopsis dassonvillei subsp. dassonvillei DSM 43111]APC33707.1 hypothetical protein A9R04_02845 [Nocardiopsis dassonvillei]ASU56564.1 hypothetical protein CGQ36_02945 [Nocardiopsis dassonvillei]NKY77061.1 hypothetical protein [Nocardiopsis dassonvillei]VEI91340.1 Uncharacterised protein [Nocardiopsis dassonvillei]